MILLMMMGSRAVNVDAAAAYADADFSPGLDNNGNDDDDDAGGPDDGEPAQLPFEAHGLVAPCPRLELPGHRPCHCKFYHQGTVRREIW